MKINVWLFEDGILDRCVAGSEADKYRNTANEWKLISTEDYTPIPPKKVVTKTVDAQRASQGKNYVHLVNNVGTSEYIPDNATNIRISYDVEE